MPDAFGEGLQFYMPPPHGGSLSVIESVLLLKLMRCVDPYRIFEFGTFDGRTTRLLLDNLADDGTTEKRIYTIDLPGTDGVRFQADDQVLAEKSLRSVRKYTLSPRRHLVQQILQDSMALNAEQYRAKFQFIFIDANHELSYVRKDTENAFTMISGDKYCIAWHDYGNARFPELTDYLDALGAEVSLYHIEETMLVFHLAGLNAGPRTAAR